MTTFPTSLRIAIGFVIALWLVGLTALACGAPGEIVLAAAIIGTAGAFVEWTCHLDPWPVLPSSPEAGDAPATVQMQYEAEPDPQFRRKH